MIDLRYNLSLLAYKLKNKLNRKKDGDEEEDFNDADNYREDFTDDDDVATDSYSDEETPEDGDIVIPDDEDDEGSQAKMLRRKHILLAAGAVLFVGAGAMAYSSMNPTTAGGNKEAKKSLSQNVAQTQDTDLPTKYSDISKYQKNGKNTNGKTSAAGATNGQATPPSSGYGNGTSSSSSSPSSSGSSNRTYNTQQPAVSRSSAPRASASAPSAAAAPRATATVTSSPAPAQPQMSAEEKAALKAEQDAKKAESDAMNSSIAFKIAQTVTQAVTGAGTVQAAEPKVSQASPFAATPYAQSFVGSDNEFANEAGSNMYTLQAGTVIPATLQTGITSDSPNGDCIAIVRQDVYDSLTGTHLLIPQGAKIIGKYGESGARGNHRIGVAFSRIILPDGRSINLPNQNAIDGTGMPGLAEKYTNHTGSLFKTAFMTALLGSAAQSATGNTSGDDNRSPGQEAVSGAVAQVMQTASQILNREGNTSPTITISPGHAFNIFINQDLSLGEYDE